MPAQNQNTAVQAMQLITRIQYLQSVQKAGGQTDPILGTLIPLSAAQTASITSQLATLQTQLSVIVTPLLPSQSAQTPV